VNFGNTKPGMGVLLDLGAPKVVTYVNVLLNAAGTTVELRGGDSDPGATTAGDDTVVKTFKLIGEPKPDSPSTVVLPGSDQPVRYLLVFITKMPVDPADARGRAQIAVQEITVFTP
jgi:hypothetical protein